MLIASPRGGFSFLKGISPYSAGAVASPGYEIEHATLGPPLPLRAGFDRVARHLAALGRPKQALCGMELRSPRPFTFQGFSDFNAGYVKVLMSWDIFQDGLNPVARTNVAPEIDPPSEPALYGFSYTVAAKDAPKTFVVAGAGELPEGSLDPHDVVRRGETSADAVAGKARFVMGLMTSRLAGLGVGWPQATVTGVYTVHDIHPLLSAGALRPVVVWHYARPPIVSIEFEMDVRGCRRELVL
ncbi:MAG: 2-amino-5-chloromuconate deaminase CnbZ [Bryobacteraceae bacterium]